LRIRALAATWLLAALAPAAASAGDDSSASGAGGSGPAQAGGRVYGRLKAEYRYENAHLESGRDIDDQDVLLTATVGTERLLLENLETRFSARLSKDIDGAFDERGGREEWIDLRDVRYAPRHLVFPTQAYARLTDVGGLLDVTAGRQYAREVEWAHFDGVAVASDRKGGSPWSAGGFVGRRVDFWRTLEDQVVAGGHAGWRLGLLDLGVSDVYLVRNSFEAKASAATDGPLSGGIEGVVQASFRMIDERPDIYRLLANPRQEEWGTDFTLVYEHKLRTGRKTFNFDYVSIDGDVDRLRFSELAPYHRLEGTLWQRVFEPLGVFVGVDWLRLADEVDADGFNSSYVETSGGVDLSGFPARGSHLSAKASYSDFHRPPLRPGGGFDDLRGTGEEEWFEVLLEARQSFGRFAAVGFEYVYEEFDLKTRLARAGRIRSQSYRLFAKVRPLEGLSIRVDLFLADDLPNVYEDDLDRAEGAWASVEYSF
jgi:hypothetical protein